MPVEIPIKTHAYTLENEALRFNRDLQSVEAEIKKC